MKQCSAVNDGARCGRRLDHEGSHYALPDGPHAWDVETVEAFADADEALDELSRAVTALRATQERRSVVLDDFSVALKAALILFLIVVVVAVLVAIASL